MKIVLYGLNFAPEPTGIGKYTGEMAAWLAAQGHQVRVVTGYPYYPEWKVKEGYSHYRVTQERWAQTDVIRVPLWVPENPTGFTRVLHLASFALASLPSLLRQTSWRPDVICVVAPAFACAPGAWLAARLCKAKSWLHIQDFEVDAAFRMGLLSGRWSQRVITALERLIFRRFDKVSTISNRMLERLSLKGVKPDRIVSFPNWVDTGAIQPAARTAAYRTELGIAPGAVVALYSGSMAGKQGLELLPIVARRVEALLPELVFVLCGNGVCKPGLEKDCEGLGNVRMLPLQPAHRLGELLVFADIHLLPQHADASDLVMPSKLTGMLASGRPVIATSRAGTELATVLHGRGIVVPPDDVDAFAAALTELVGSDLLRRRLGESARRYAEENLSRDRVLARFEDALRRCVVPRSARTSRRRDADAMGEEGAQQSHGSEAKRGMASTEAR